MRRLILTVDVEAFPKRQATDHVERLVWGRFGDKQGGILEMMDVADQFGYPLTFFVDFCERFLHPGKMEEVARCIVERGHDLQLHAHPEFLPPEFWARHGLPDWNTSLSGYTAERAGPLMDFLLESARAAGANPVAFRGGAFRYNHEVLRAMRARDVALSFNYNLKAAHQPNNSEDRSIFRWSNDVVEVPAGHSNMRGAGRPFDINQMDLSDRQGVHEYLDDYFRRFGEDAVLVMVMHSWSFCERDRETGHFELRGDQLQRAFESFLRELPPGYGILNASQLAKSVAAGDVPTNEVLDINLVDRDRQAVDTRVNPTPRESPLSVEEPVPTVRSACNYCGTPANLMEDFGGRTKVRCPTCRSLERNRILLWVYERFVRSEFDLAEKRVLLVAPADAEASYFRRHAKVTTCDVRPVSSFDRQIDICRMPEVADASFDSVIAIGVLQHCHDDEAAMDEVRRILVPGGRFFLHVSFRTNVETEQIADQTKHYGKEALELYRVGTYRYYGDLPLLRSLQRRFLVKTFYGVDPVTLTASVIFCGVRDPAA